MQQEKQTIQKMHEQAKALGACATYTGREDTLEAISDLLMTAQGREFCISHGFPTLAMFREYKPYRMERYGIYIDAGRIHLRNPRRAVLIGRTVAEVEMDEIGRKAQRIMVLHGATATITTRGWAVAKVDSDRMSRATTREIENSIIL